LHTIEASGEERKYGKVGKNRQTNYKIVKVVEGRREKQMEGGTEPG
jgi:hypothetical protein